MKADAVISIAKRKQRVKVFLQLGCKKNLSLVDQLISIVDQLWALAEYSGRAWGCLRCHKHILSRASLTLRYRIKAAEAALQAKGLRCDCALLRPVVFSLLHLKHVRKRNENTSDHREREKKEREREREKERERENMAGQGKNWKNININHSRL